MVIRIWFKIFCFLLLIALATGCGKHFKRAKLPPVREGWQQAAAGKNAYVVQKKDTLYSIAEKHYGDGMRYKEIMELNGLKTKILKVGQIIKY